MRSPSPVPLLLMLATCRPSAPADPPEPVPATIAPGDVEPEARPVGPTPSAPAGSLDAAALCARLAESGEFDEEALPTECAYAPARLCD